MRCRIGRPAEPLGSPPSLSLSWSTLHNHSAPHLSVLLSGRYREELDGQRYECGPGSALIKPAMADHANTIHERSVSLIVEVEPTAGGQPAIERLFSRTSRLDASPFVGLLSRIRRDLGSPDDCSALIVHGAVLELLGELGRAETGSTRRACLRKTIDYVKAHHARPIKLTDAARVAGLSVPRLVREFRTQLGCSVGEYVRRVRIDRALTELQRNDTTVSRVAHDVGFTDQSHFTRVFKQHVGTTPARYRRAQLD
jgi:AraC family transcriptional regulator